jgi:molybdopterin/thiamine biosynthesis adenylyltransferase
MDKRKFNTRYQDALWANQIQQILVVGLGGIGNGVTQQIASIGHQMTLQDFDEVSIENVYPQQFKPSQIGMSKLDAVKQLLLENLDYIPFRSISDRFTTNSEALPYTFSCVDNMLTRKHIFEAWLKLDNRELLLDCRMSAESFDIFACTKDTESAYVETLYLDNEVTDAPCTYKITRFVANIAQGIMVQNLCNYLSNLPLSFKFEYRGQINTAQWI